MRNDSERISRVERLLAVILRTRPAPEPEGRWRDGVLRQIRGLALEKEWADRFWPDRRIWRLAVTMAVAALIVTVLALKIGFAPEQEIMSLLSEYPAEFTQPQSFGL